MFIAGCSALCLLVCLPLFLVYQKNRPALAACFKSLGTFCALVIALVAAVRLDQRCWICVSALALHAAADFVLEYSLAVGMGLFLCGHICYIGFFLVLFPVSIVHLICFACLIGIAVFVLYSWRRQAGKQLPLFVFYATVLCAMTACGIAGGIRAFSLQGLLTAIGAAMFLFSDLLVCRKLLFPSGRLMPWIIMITYYCAQLLFASSCLLI